MERSNEPVDFLLSQVQELKVHYGIDELKIIVIENAEPMLPEHKSETIKEKHRKYVSTSHGLEMKTLHETAAGAMNEFFKKMQRGGSFGAIGLNQFLLATFDLEDTDAGIVFKPKQLEYDKVGLA